MQIPAYCTIDFIEEITKRNPVDFITPDNILAGKTHYEVMDLIANGLKIKTDCSEEKLKGKTTNPFINYLIKNRRIECSEKDFQELRANNKSFFQKMKDPTCLYLLTGFDSLSNDYSEQTGHYFFSLKSKLDGLFEERIQTFNVDSPVLWDFAKGYFDTHHSIVFADPYLYKSKQALEKLIENMLPKKLMGRYTISLILSDNCKLYSNGLPSKSEIQIWVNHFKEKINRSINAVIEFHICNNEDFHDRVIITNNGCVFSGIGFGMIRHNSSKKDTTWIGFKPFKRVKTNNDNSVLVYKLMKNKLSTIKSWILKSDQRNTQNPLFA